MTGNYDWARIYRHSVGLEDITLRQATVTDFEHGLVTVTGLQRICTDSRLGKQFPLTTKEVELSAWDPRRLFGIKTGKTQVRDIPDDYSLEDLYFEYNQVESVYKKHEFLQRTYRVNRVWLEVSPD
jgi:hypothetical protein